MFENGNELCCVVLVEAIRSIILFGVVSHGERSDELGRRLIDFTSKTSNELDIQLLIISTTISFSSYAILSTSILFHLCCQCRFARLLVQDLCIFVGMDHPAFDFMENRRQVGT